MTYSILTLDYERWKTPQSLVYQPAKTPDSLNSQLVRTPDSSVSVAARTPDGNISPQRTLSAAGNTSNRSSVDYDRDHQFLHLQPSRTPDILVSDNGRHRSNNLVAEGSLRPDILVVQRSRTPESIIDQEPIRDQIQQVNLSFSKILKRAGGNLIQN